MSISRPGGKIHLSCCLFFFLITSISYAQKNANPFLPSYKAIFTEAPGRIPTAQPSDAPVAGNGDIGAVLGGTPDKLCIYLGKNDFWKSKEGYPEGGLCLPGGINIFIPELEGASYYAEQVLANGNINATFQKGNLVFLLKVFVPATSNMLVAEMSATGGSCTVNMNVWAKQGFESRVDSGQKGNVLYAQRHFDSAGLDWPSHVAIAATVIGAKGKSFILKPSAKVILAAGICTNHEKNSYLNTAISRAKNATTASIQSLKQKNGRWWQQFWAKSQISIGDTMLEKYYYGSQYLLACCSRNRKFPPGLCGNAITDDAKRAWQGDYHTNYNYEAAWWGCYSSNHIELTEGYEAPIFDYMPKAKSNAKEILKCNGVYYPVGIGPKGFASSKYPLTEEKMKAHYGISDVGLEGGEMFAGQKSNAVFLTANMLLRFYHTYDKNYAAKIYPYLTAVADFWDSYLKYENGHYNSYNDNFWEVGPWAKGWREDLQTGDTNNTATLGLLKMFYKGIIDVSIFLNKDKEKAAKWKLIQEYLYPLPVLKYNDVTRLIATQRSKSSGNMKRTVPGFGRLMGYTWVFPSGIAGVKTDSAFASILRKEVGRWDTEPGGDPGWKNMGNGFEAYYTIAARVGYNPATIIKELKERIPKTALPNLWVLQKGGFTETLSGIPSCINEMLLQGYEGMIRVFPAWEGDASFNKLRTYGAFLVSSQKKEGAVQFIKIISEKGRDCVIENPWRGKQVSIVSNGKKVTPVYKEENTFYFTTKAGAVYTIVPN